MKKLNLNLDELHVDTFETQPPLFVQGTVRGYVSEIATGCDGCATYRASECGCSGESGCDTMDACCMANTRGTRTCETTCNQIICGCSAYFTDCDATCTNYQHAAEMSCGC
jgi:hypothetical protein